LGYALRLLILERRGVVVRTASYSEIASYHGIDIHVCPYLDLILKYSFMHLVEVLASRRSRKVKVKGEVVPVL
jgi:hypothetical protein